MQRNIVALALGLAACADHAENDGGVLDAVYSESTSDLAYNSESTYVTDSPTDSLSEDVASTNRQLTIRNQCKEAIFVGLLNGASTPFLPANGGFQLTPDSEQTVSVPAKWTGRIWGRSKCSFDSNGKGLCATGDCGGKLACAGAGGKPPVTLAEFTFSGFGGKDFYDVSLVDGYNLPMKIAPTVGSFSPSGGGEFDCGAPTCTSDVNLVCPPELQVRSEGAVVACMSAHEACKKTPNNALLACAQNDDLYQCLSGGANNVSGSCYSPNASSSCCGCPAWSPSGACKARNAKWELPSLPEKYAKIFKDACPRAYAFPYDDVTSTYTCIGKHYNIVFCP